MSRRRKKGIDFVDDTFSEEKSDNVKSSPEEEDYGQALLKDTKGVDFSFLESIDEETEESKDNQPLDVGIIEEKPYILDNSVVKNSGIEDVNFNSNFLRDADIEALAQLIFDWMVVLSIAVPFWAGARQVDSDLGSGENPALRP